VRLCYPYLLRKGDSLGSKTNVVTFVPAFAEELTKEQFTQRLDCSFNAGAKENGPPEEFREYFTECFSDYTEYQLEELSGISERYIRKIKNERVTRPRLSHLIALCVAGDLKYRQSLKLLEYAGYVLRDTQEEKLYDEFLLVATNITVSTCNEVLFEYGYTPLTNTKSKTTKETVK